jgi:hypothetical protein
MLPPSRGRMLLFGGLAAVLIVAIAVALQLVGARQVFSPGDVASPHARIDLRCAQCHSPVRGVVALRCERCHDAIGSDRLQLSAHVLFGSGDSRLAHGAGERECATCHVEHRGRGHDLRAVSDGQCASCHFRNLGSHPNFEALRAAQTASSLRFDHDRHVLEAEKTKGAASCQTCHEQTSDRRGFQSINFERHCASCHLENGRLKGTTDPMELQWLVMPNGDPIEPRQAQAPIFTPANRGRETAGALEHRDAFVLFNAARLRRAIDRDGVAAELSSLESRIGYLDQLRSTPPPRLIPVAERAQAIATLRTEIAALDSTLASASSSTNDAAALDELSAAAQAVMTSLGADANTMAIEVDGTFESRRRSLLRLLDAIDARVPDSARDRVSRLRRQVLAVQAGSSGAGDLATARRLRQRQLDRLELETEIGNSAIDRLDEPTQDGSLDRAEIERRLTLLRGQFENLSRSPRGPVPTDEAERAAQSRTLVSLLTPCRKCHEMDAAATRLQPVRVAEPVLRRSVFNHAPHLLQTKCESCHANVRTSKAATDVSLPSIDSCRTCHNRSQVRDDCATCHRFHPSSLVPMAAALP